MAFIKLQNFTQVKKCKDDIVVPTISKTSAIEGAQFDFKGILLEMVEIEVSNYWLLPTHILITPT